VEESLRVSDALVLRVILVVDRLACESFEQCDGDAFIDQVVEAS
jgi:hypothetical protein